MSFLGLEVLFLVLSSISFIILCAKRTRKRENLQVCPQHVGHRGDGVGLRTMGLACFCVYLFAKMDCNRFLNIHPLVGIFLLILLKIYIIQILLMILHVLFLYS